MPKVELHVHLEGAIQPTTAIEIMQRNKAQHAPQTPEELHQLYSFTDLTHFVRAMKTVTNHLVRLEDLYRVCREMLEILPGRMCAMSSLIALCRNISTWAWICKRS